MKEKIDTAYITTYILEGKTPVKCEDFDLWRTWMRQAERTVAKDTVNGYEISTRFLGQDAGFFDDTNPRIFETAWGKKKRIGIFSSKLPHGRKQKMPISN